MRNLSFIPKPFHKPTVSNGKQVLFKGEKAIVLIIALVFVALFPIIVNAEHSSFKDVGKMAECVDVNAIQSTIVIQDDIYLYVNSEAFARNIYKVRIYTNSSKTTLVDTYEGCGNVYCTYNLQTEGLATGTYFVEVETSLSTFFSGWINYE